MMLKILAGVVFSILIGYLMLYFFQEQLLFHPRKFAEDAPYSFLPAHEEVNLLSRDGTKLNHVYIHNRDEAGVVLFFNGNGGRIATSGVHSDLFTDNDYSVFYHDYRGYGKSGGKIESELQLIEDAQLAYDYLKQRYPEDQITICGLSMGTGIATALASKNNPERLILCAPYFSLENIVREKTLVVPRMMLKYRFDTASRIGHMDCPVYIIHGKRDEVIPYRHALQLLPLNKNCKLLPLEHCGHRLFHCDSSFKAQISQCFKS